MSEQIEFPGIPGPGVNGGYTALYIYPPGTFMENQDFRVFVGGSGLDACKSLEEARDKLLQRAVERCNMYAADGDTLAKHYRAQRDALLSGGLTRSIPPIITPTPAPPAPTDGDAISRVYLLDKLKSFHPEMLYVIETAPAVALPSPRYGVDDVMGGVGWNDGAFNHRVVGASGGICLIAERDSETGGRHFSKKAVAAMLNVAETVSFPVGHPRNPTPEPEPPSLLEAAKAFMQEASTRKRIRTGEHGFCAQRLRDLQFAIERAEAEGK